jgi:hypothetical protein
MGLMNRIDELVLRARAHSSALRMLGCLVAAFFAAPGMAAGAQPKPGAWQSGGNAEPRVAFDVSGGGAHRRVLRVTVPLTCRRRAEPYGWSSSDPVARVRVGGRFTAYGFDFALRGRLVTRERAEVAVREDDGGCHDRRRYAVNRYGGRVSVGTGRYLAVVGGAAGADLQVNAFGRMVTATFLEGSVTAACSDGSQRPLALAGPDDLILAAPIRPTGRFDMTAASGGASISVDGTFTHGSVAALVFVTDVLADGTRCQARGVRLVRSIAFPESSGGWQFVMPGPPVQRLPSG